MRAMAIRLFATSSATSRCCSPVPPWPGEKAAAGATADRSRARLKEEEKREKPVEIRFSLPDPWSRQMVIAPCRWYGSRPYRYPRSRRQSVWGRRRRRF
jgi:hypothetical protein